MHKKSKLLLLSATCMTVILSGCGTTKKADPGAASDAPAAAKFSTEPVTVRFATSGGIYSEDEFKKYVQDPVAKKYPNITLQYISTSVTGQSLNDLVASGNIPDIAVGYGAVIKQLIDLGLYDNIEPLIKKYNFDVKRLIPETVEYFKINGPTDYLGGLPAYNNAFGLFYNKTLFDKFAQPYPKDGMIWEEVGDLGKKLTRIDGGVQYRGLFPDGINRMVNQVTIPQIDDNDKATINSDPRWKKAFELWNYIYKYPGNSDAKFNKINNGDNQTAFLEGTLAMMSGYSTGVLNQLRKTPIDFNIVTYPQHKDHMGYSTNVDTPDMCITAQSKVKDAAFMVLQTILSDEVQTDLSRNAKMSVLANKTIQGDFGKDIPEFAGKNINLSAMTKLTPSVPKVSKYGGSDTNQVIIDAYQAVLSDQMDINSALRDADEKINKIIADKKAK